MSDTAKKGDYGSSVGRLAVDAIVIILLGLIFAKLCQFEVPEQQPIIVPEEIKFTYDQPPIVVNIPETMRITVDTNKVEIEQKMLPEIRTIIKEAKTEEEVKELLGVEEGDVDPLDPKVKVSEAKAEEPKKKFEIKKLLPWNWLRKKKKD